MTSARGGPEPEYRRATEADRPGAMRVLELANFSRIPSPEMPSFDLERCFVAEVGGAIVGVAGYDVLPDGRGKTTLMAVDPPYRGTGIGHRLQELRMRALRELGCEVVVTNADLPETITWYKRTFGYREVGRVQKLHEFGSAEIDAWTTLEAPLDR
jgi:GNAT superfamily N-acetyltransferase